jgi:hypothetical protein
LLQKAQADSFYSSGKLSCWPESRHFPNCPVKFHEPAKPAEFPRNALHIWAEFADYPKAANGG